MTKLLLMIWSLYMAAALDISDDARVEITCTGSGLNSGFPQWSINGTNHVPAVLRSLGIAVIPESVVDAIDQTSNTVFQTLVINGSAAVHGTTIRCVFAGEDMFPTTGLVYLAALPPPEDLTVSEGGLVQWQPPYSSLETEAIRYFLYNISYSVEVTDILTQETIMYNETGSTSMSFQLPTDCIEYTVTVTARCDTGAGDPTAVNMTTYETPGPVDAKRINATLHGNTLTVIVTAQYVLNCSDPTLYYIIYNNQQYDIQADDEMELSINITNTDTCIFAVKASNPAGSSSLTRVGIDGCGISSETPSPTDNVSERKPSAVIPAVAATVAACGLLLIITVSIISLILCSKWQRKNRVEHKTETVYVGNMPEDMSKSKGMTRSLLSSSSDKSDSSHGSSVPSSARSSTDTTTTMVDEKTPPSSPKEKKSNQEPLGDEYDHVTHQEKTYAEVSVLKQKTKCVQPPDEGVIYSGIQHTKYADVTLQKPKCSPPADGSAEPVLYSLVQLQEQV